MVLSANADPLASGLDKAAGDVHKWAHKVEAGAAGAGAGKGGGLISALLTGGKFVGGAVAAGIGASLTAIPAAVDGMKALAKEGRAADALGIASDKYMGIAHAFSKIGVEGDGLTNVFGRLAKATEEGKTGAGPAAEKFRQLGLNAAELSKLPLDQQLLRVSDAIAKLPPGGQQAAAAMELFGKSGATLLPILSKGSAGLEKQIEHAKKLGLALDPTQMERVQRAAAAVPRIGAVFDGVKNKFLAAIAPAVESWGNLLERGIELVSPLIDKALEGVSAYYTTIAELGSAVVEHVGAAAAAFADWVGGMAGGQITLGSVTDNVLGLLKAVTKGGAYMWDGLSAGYGAFAIVFGKLENLIADFVLNFKSSIKDLFQTLAKLPDAMGGKTFRDMAANSDKMVDAFAGGFRKTGDGLEAWGHRQIDTFGNTAKNVDGIFDRIRVRLAGGLGDKLKGVAAELAAVSEPVKLGGALDVNSKEAYSAVTKYQTQQTVDAPAQDLRKRAVKAAEDALKVARDTLAAVKALQPLGSV